MGKGSARRPQLVDEETMDRRWEQAFGPDTKNPRHTRGGEDGDDE